MSAHGHGHGGAGLVTSRRARRVLVVLSAAVAVLSLLGLGVLWPAGGGAGSASAAASSAAAGASSTASAVVRSVRSRTCRGTAADQLPDGSIPATTSCPTVRARLTSGPDAGASRTITIPAQVQRGGIGSGDRIQLSVYPASSGSGRVYAWRDFSRTRPLALVVGVFAVVVVLVGRRRGAAALVGLVLAYATIAVVVVPALARGERPTLVALVASSAIMSAVLYLAHGFSLKTAAAHLGTTAGLLLSAVLAPTAVAMTHLRGLDGADSTNLTVMTGQTDLSSLVLAGIVIAGLGVLNDVTMTQASAVWELREAAPGASPAALFRRGMSIGRDHLASTVYTLAFAYAGASLPTLLLLHLQDEPLSQVLGSSAVAEEVVRTAVGAICLVAAIPLTTAVAAAAVSTAIPRPAHAPDDASDHMPHHASDQAVDAVVDLRTTPVLPAPRPSALPTVPAAPARRGRHAAS